MWHVLVCDLVTVSIKAKGPTDNSVIYSVEIVVYLCVVCTHILCVHMLCHMLIVSDYH